MTAPARKKACIYTLGCRLNQSETGIIADRLQAAGYELAPLDSRADLYIINTCTVTAEADAKSRKTIRAFIRRNPEAFVAVIGCYSELNAALIAKIPGVDLVVGNNQKLEVLDYIGDKKNAAPVIVCNGPAKDDFTIDVAKIPDTVTKLLTHRANLKIQEGCNCMCSYCVVPFARGKPRSRDMDNLRDEARALMCRGVKEIVLSGINVGAYASEGMTLMDVVDRLDGLGIPRLRIGSIELTTLSAPLLERMKDVRHALVPFLHIPVQSGSDRILRAMSRPYSSAKFLRFVEQANAVVPDLCIGTDIMVGFPGETDEDFEATCTLLRQSPLAYAHVFKYSERKGTPASRFPDKINPRTTNTRSDILRRISDEKRSQFHQQFLGRTVEVLFEQQENGLWRGYTGNYLYVAASSDRFLENTIVPVTLLEDHRDYISGKIE